MMRMASNLENFNNVIIKNKYQDNFQNKIFDVMICQLKLYYLILAIEIGQVDLIVKKKGPFWCGSNVDGIM